MAYDDNMKYWDAGRISKLNVGDTWTYLVYSPYIQENKNEEKSPNLERKIVFRKQRIF